MSERRTMYAAHLLTLLLVAQLPRCAAELKCPELAYIGSEASLTCIGASTTHTYTMPSGSTASTCSVTSKLCIDTGVDTGTVINATQTVLTISSVKKSDAGEWGCTLGSEPTPSKCSMTIAKMPSCDITSVPSPDDLRVHQSVSLSVNATGYYCSKGMKLQLRIGSNVAELKLGNPDVITDDSFQLQLNLTESYFGNVSLEFTCDSKQKDISCSGIRSLMQKRQMEEVTADASSRPSICIGAMVGAIVAGSVAATIIFMLVVVLVKIKQSKRSQQPETHSDRNVYDSPNDVDGQTDETSGHGYNTLYLTPVEGGNIYNVISS